jgi:hypothetical protein
MSSTTLREPPAGSSRKPKGISLFKQTYHVPIDWRRAKFSLSHPTVAPTCENTATTSDRLSLFVPCRRILDVIMIRDWLYTAALRCHLLGCYESVTSFFSGIVFCFDTVADLLLFQRQWMPVEIA